MITLCITAAAVFTGYAYIHNLEQELGLEKKRISDIEEKQTAQSAVQEPPTDEYVDAVSLIDMEELNEPETPESDMVEIDKGKILTYDSYVGYSWVPVLAGVKTNQYDKTCFRRNSEDRMEYVVDGEVSSYFGIDVSSHQGDINWDAVRSDGVEFAVLRIGFRGYAPEGNIRVDEKFVQNYEGAHNAGIDLGVYFYSQAISVEEAVEEAEFLLEQLNGRTLEYPVVFDWEPVDTYDPEDVPRTEDVMPGTLTLAAAAFCEKIKDAGYDAMVYTNKKMAYIKYDLRLLENYPKWLALYNDDMTYYYDFDMWQYGFCKVDGIEGDVDADIAIIR
jgi:GH25 family lysozyme M1 (1,4-beta-N-acetylmuramidase)